MKNLIFILDTEKYEAELGDNTVVDQILELLPLELEFTANGSIEYNAKFPKEIETESLEGVSKARRNQIGLISEANTLSIFINDCDIEPEKLIYLGSFKDDIAAELVKSASRVRITIEEGEES